VRVTTNPYTILKFSRDSHHFGTSVLQGRELRRELEPKSTAGIDMCRATEPRKVDGPFSPRRVTTSSTTGESRAAPLTALSQ